VGSVLAPGMTAETGSDPTAALQVAIATAESSLQKGDLKAAESRYREALAEGWLLIGRLERHAGQVEPAVRALDEAAAAKPLDPERVFLLATEYLWLKKVDAAERLFAQVVQARPIPQTHVLIGRSYRDAGEYDRARAALRAGLAQDPTVRRAHYYLGMVLLADARTGEGRLEQAMAEFREELKQDPQDPPTNDQLGVALLEADRPAEALPALEAAVRGEARPLHLYHLGRAQLALDRPADAAATLKRALERAGEQETDKADLEKFHYQLGLALRKLGRTEEAARHLAEARRLSSAPADPPAQQTELKKRVRGVLARAYLNLGVMQAQGEQHVRAAELFEKAGELDPELAQVPSSLGVAYFNAKEYDKATGPLTRALLAKPEDGGLKRMLAMAWLNARNYTRAAELLRDDAEVETDPSLQFAYGLALVKSERAAEAERVFSRLLAAHGDSAELSVLLGQASAQQGDFDAAVESLKRALRLKADVAEANATLGVIYLKQGKLAEAEEALRAELKTQPADVKSQQNLAAVLDMEQRPEEAVVLLRGVVKASPDSADARYLLGKILLGQGAVGEAVEQLEAAARLSPEDANVQYQLGRAYQKLGREEQAQKKFELFRQLKDKRRGSVP
jgi:tetratricopeptide (TPR) repeat protein